MGQYLSTPNTEKEVVSGQAKHVLGKIQYAIASHQGWRRTQEDAHIAVALSDEHFLFGVYDGHGGEEVAQFCSREMPLELPKIDSFVHGNYSESLVSLFHLMDEKMRSGLGREQLGNLREKSQYSVTDDAFQVFRKVMALQQHVDQENTPSPGDRSQVPESTSQAGCTAIVALLHHDRLYIANAGDSRAVLSRAGHALPLSFDHKPGHSKERERVIAAGGFISEIGGVCRVNGNLSLSRAIGDLRYKSNGDLSPASQIITAEPDVEQITLTSEDRFFVLACDGIWDVLTNQEVVDFVNSRLDSGESPTQIATDLLDRCVASDPRETRGIGCDNMTACIVVLRS